MLLLTAEPSRCYERAFKIIPLLSCQGLYSAVFLILSWVIFWIICLHHDSFGFSLEMTFSASLESSLSLKMGPKAVAHWMVKLITKKVSFCKTSHHTLASKLHCRDNAPNMSRWQIGMKANISSYLIHLSGSHKGAWEVSWFLPLNCYSTREWIC